jgi:hypothetical protein
VGGAVAIVGAVKSAAAQIEEFASRWLTAHGTNCKTTEARRKVIEGVRNP